ncbi:MAG: Ada metal-binding domain-containing protein [Allorhizobium sp.]
MSLDIHQCEQAWLARDPEFDGRFFIGVRTTGIYCRCVCPVRQPYRCNIEFLPSAAAAVVSRMWWKLASSALRACNVGSGQAARSRDIGTRG